MTATTTGRRYPTMHANYWAALATVGDVWTTVWGSHYGAEVDPQGAVKYGAALFTTREGAETYAAQYGPTMAPGAEDRAPVVAYVTYSGGSHYRTATDPAGRRHIGETCETCGAIHGTDAALAVGRFDPNGVHGYRSALGGPVWSTREAAVADYCFTTRTQ